MRKIFTENLPKKKYGQTMIIDWKKAVGLQIPFIYDNIKENIKVEKHEKGNYVVISYQKKLKRMRTCHFLQLKFRDLLYKDKRRLQVLDLKNIPKKNNRYDWVHSAKRTIAFEFNGIAGELYIKEYQRINGYGYLIIVYENKEYKIRNINLLNGKIAKIISFGKYHYEIGQIIKKEKKNITILDRKRKKEKNSSIIRKVYKYHCNCCGYENWIEETLLAVSKIVCKNCAHKTVVKGKTDIKTEAPWLALFFQEKDKHLIYTERKHSNKKIYPICPECSYIRKTPMQIATIYKYHSISCPCCSDKVSYPEKFVLAFFKQLNVDLIYQPKKSELKWCGRYFYDFYDKKKNVVIEVNGMQHYKKIKHYKKTLKEIQKIDKEKKTLAIKNHMKYLVIDCRYSTLEYIKKSLLSNKELQKNYPFKEKDIDFLECEYATIKSIYFKIYKYKKLHPNITNKLLAKKYGINRCTIGKALKKMQKYLE